jgi:transposase
MEIRGGKRFWTKAERREIVEETLKAGASVSAVARAHDLNSNQVFFWRRQYRQGCFDESRSKTTALVPVKISPATGKGVVASQRALKLSAKTISGTIDIDLGHARVRIAGSADPACVRAALEGLVR